MTDLLGGALEAHLSGVSMLEPEFYDVAMTGEGEPAMLPLEESPWLRVYDEAARCIANAAPVVDLGCGTGRFLHRMIEGSHYASLTGIDFSPAALAESEEYLRGVLGAGFSDRVSLELCDLREWEPERDRHGRTVYTCLEVLEHLEDDLGLVRRLPAGHEFVFSVPNYLSAAHQRAFGSLSEVFGRFDSLLRIRRWALVEFSEKNVVHVVAAVRRSDSW